MRQVRNDKTFEICFKIDVFMLRREGRWPEKVEKSSHDGAYASTQKIEDEREEGKERERIWEYEC